MIKGCYTVTTVPDEEHVDEIFLVAVLQNVCSKTTIFKYRVTKYDKNISEPFEILFSSMFFVTFSLTQEPSDSLFWCSLVQLFF